VRVIGNYTIERELGHGGMATVYLSRDTRHDRSVAVKVLRPEIAQSIGADRFLREIHLAAKLSHPHILPLFDSGEADGCLYYVMPNVEGLSLRDRISAEGKLPIEDALKVTREVADALDYAHRHGVVHRDIKPENIMLHDGHALVADFGIGKALSAVDDQVFTQTGMTVGTPAYMSPEQAAGDAIDGRSDIYSLGCVLYEMLTGEQPFTGPTAQAVIAKRFVQTPTDVSGLREGVSRIVAKVVQRALARSPIDRFETGASLIAALSQSESASQCDSPEKSIAVLPFANMSTDPENEFFADGITEEILNALAQIPELRVAGRTSAFSFKGKNVDLRIIGEKLNVRTVLEGSVRRSGKRVRIAAQLIDVSNGYHLWSEKYDREIEDVFAVQDEIAVAIAERMRVTVNQDRGAALSQRATDNISAYEAYLKGRALLYQRGPAVKQGMALMEQALALDPSYGLAWAGLADAYTLLAYNNHLRPDEASSKARSAATKALEVGPDLGEAHSARAMVSLFFEWDFEAAERGFKRAMELNPGYIQGACWYYFQYLGFAALRWEEAIEGTLGLQQREPQSGYIAAVLANSYSVSGGDPEQAVRWADKAVELEPKAFLSLWARQLALFRAQQWSRSIEAAETALAMSGRSPLPLPTLAMALIESGQVDDARAVYEEMRSRSRREIFGTTSLALVAAALGEKVAAIEFAREAFRVRDPHFPIFTAAWRQSNALQALPEFQEILTAMKLPRSERSS
jgi:eukaryotic-like serine/threonine-protein kinase